jgi:hypothetical protein
MLDYPNITYQENITFKNTLKSQRVLPILAIIRGYLYALSLQYITVAIKVIFWAQGDIYTQQYTY